MPSYNLRSGFKRRADPGSRGDPSLNPPPAKQPQLTDAFPLQNNIGPIPTQLHLMMDSCDDGSFYDKCTLQVVHPPQDPDSASPQHVAVRPPPPFPADTPTNTPPSNNSPERTHLFSANIIPSEGRVEFLSGADDNPSPTISDDVHAPVNATQTWIFKGLEWIHTGRLWEIYRGQLMDKAALSEPINVILKIIDTEKFDEEIPEDAVNYLGYGYHTRWTAINAARNEDKIYRHLRPLQGTLVPRYYGLFEGSYAQKPWDDTEEAIIGADPQVMAMVLEDVGPQAPSPDYGPVREYNYQLEDKRMIIGRYDKLHQDGRVLQAWDNLKIHHVLKRGSKPPSEPDHWVIVDFHKARVLDGNQDEVKRKVHDEDRTLLKLWNLKKDSEGNLVTDLVFKIK